MGSPLGQLVYHFQKCFHFLRVYVFEGEGYLCVLEPNRIPSPLGLSLPPRSPGSLEPCPSTHKHVMGYRPTALFIQGSLQICLKEES